MKKHKMQCHQIEHNLLSIIVVDFSEKTIAVSAVESKETFGTDQHHPRIVVSPDNISTKNNLMLQENQECEEAYFSLEKIKCPWLVMLKANEMLTDDQIFQIMLMISKKPPAIMTLSVANRLSDKQIANFNWVLTHNIFSRPAREIATYHTLEPRIFHRSCLQDETIRLKRNGRKGWGCYPINFNETFKDEIVTISIDIIEPHYPLVKMPRDLDIFHKGHLYYYQDLKFCERFAWPPTIYLLMRYEHMPGIIRALEKGFSSPMAVFYALRYLILNDTFDLAQKMIPLIPRRWAEKEPMLMQFVGMVHWEKGDIKKAIDAYESSLELSKESRDIDVLINVAKLYLISGMKKKALQLFNRCYDETEDLSVQSSLRRFAESIENKSDENVRISLCMVVKDEEAYLSEAIKSIRGCVDEMIVVDTGSIDNTPKIAAQCSAVIYNYDWQDDFSAARNYAIDKASGDYIFVLDADERLSSFHRLNFIFLKKLLSIRTPAAYQFSVGQNDIDTNWMNIAEMPDNFLVEKTTIRLFPRKKNIKYCNRVGESVKKSIQDNNIPIFRISPKDCQILHLKQNRAWRLDRKTNAYNLETDKSLRFISSAVKHFSATGDEQNTIKWLWELYEGYSHIRETWPSCLHLAQLLERSDTIAAKKIYFDLVNRYSTDSRIFVSTIAFLLRNNLFNELRIIPCQIHQDVNGLISIERMFYKTYSALCMLVKDCLADAVTQLESVLQINRHFLPAQVVRYYFLSKYSDPTSALSVVEDISTLLNIDTSFIESQENQSFLKKAETIAGLLKRKGYIPERTVFIESSQELIKKMVDA